MEERVERAEMVALIQDGVAAQGGVWADLGAGTGNFTWALREILGPQGTIFAVDRDARAIKHQGELIAQANPGAAILPLQADFTQPLALPALDGVLMANALHFVRDQVAVLGRISSYLRPGGRLLLVEYDLHEAIQWVPFPVPFERLQQIALAAGLSAPQLLGRRRSPSSGIVMYAGAATRLFQGVV